MGNYGTTGSDLKGIRAKLERKGPRLVDRVFHEAHGNAFSCIVCLQCANCCTTTGPLLTDRDMRRITRHLRMKEVDFVSEYIRVDEDGDQVFRSMPCPFLRADNRCSIYDHRPKACKDYPHTDRAKQHQLLRLHVKNASICPAVELVLKEVSEKPL